MGSSVASPTVVIPNTSGCVIQQPCFRVDVMVNESFMTPSSSRGKGKISHSSANTGLLLMPSYYITTRWQCNGLTVLSVQTPFSRGLPFFSPLKEAFVSPILGSPCAFCDLFFYLKLLICSPWILPSSSIHSKAMSSVKSITSPQRKII